MAVQIAMDAADSIGLPNLRRVELTDEQHWFNELLVSNVTAYSLAKDKSGSKDLAELRSRPYFMTFSPKTAPG